MRQSLGNNRKLRVYFRIAYHDGFAVSLNLRCQVLSGRGLYEINQCLQHRSSPCSFRNRGQLRQNEVEMVNNERNL